MYFSNKICLKQKKTISGFHKILSRTTVLNTDKNKNSFLNTKLAYYNYFWRWHWRLKLWLLKIHIYFTILQFVLYFWSNTYSLGDLFWENLTQSFENDFYLVSILKPRALAQSMRWLKNSCLGGGWWRRRVWCGKLSCILRATQWLA